MPRNDYESDDRYRTSHPTVRENRRAQREQNVSEAANTLNKGSREQVRELVRDPYADKE